MSKADRETAPLEFASEEAKNPPRRKISHARLTHISEKPIQLKKSRGEGWGSAQKTCRNQRLK